MTEQAQAKTALDVAREWLNTQGHSEECGAVVYGRQAECDCRAYGELARTIEAYAAQEVQRAREEAANIVHAQRCVGAKRDHKEPCQRCDALNAAETILREAHARESEGKEGR